MTSPGILAYDLGGSWCEGCGRPKLGRLLTVSLTGCPACDEAITRHRCAYRPDVGTLPAGTRWPCRACRSVWAVREETGPCGECGQPVARRCWDLAEDRQASGPRRDPAGYFPTRNLLYPAYPDTLEAEARDRREWIAGVAERLGLVLMSDK